MKSYIKPRQNAGTIAILSGLLLSLFTAWAADRIAYEQAPGHTGGDLAEERIMLVADQFQFDEVTPIRNITWWGGYANNTSAPAHDRFTIRLYADNGGKPGTLLQTFDAGNNVLRLATQNWVDLPDDDSEGRPEFEYSFDLPAPFWAEARTSYWLSIGNSLGSSDTWLWEGSAGLDHPAVWRKAKSGSWEPAARSTAFQF